MKGRMMSEYSMTAANEQNGAQEEAKVTFYATREDAEQNKPAADKLGKKRLFYCTAPNGTTRWAWTDGYASMAHQCARADGYTVGLAAKGTREVSEGAAVARLKAMDPEKRAALLRELLGEDAVTPPAPKKGGKGGK